MWGEIRKGKDIEDTVLTYTGYTLSSDDLKDISAAENEHSGSGAMIIADILSREAGVFWGYSGTDNGEHTYRSVPVYAYGPNSERFDTITDNDQLGQELFKAVSGSWH